MIVKKTNSIFDLIKTYSSTVTAIMSAGVVLYGVFRFVDQGNRNAEQIKEIKKEISILQDKFTEIHYDSSVVALNGIDMKLKRLELKVDKLTGQFTKHLANDKSVTKEELMQIMMDIESKKNYWWDTLSPKIKIKKVQ